MGSWDFDDLGDDGVIWHPHRIICRSGWSGQPGRHDHRDVATARACWQAARDEKAGIQVWPCTWLLEGRYDDGSAFTYECGLPSRFTPQHGEGSYACDGGHDHVPAEVREAQGWDYAADEDEAALLARAGVRPVQMDGKPFR